MCIGDWARIRVAVTQTNTGDLLVPVYDRKFRGETTAKSFGYASDQELEFHVDPTDAFGLLCIRKAKYGGESRLVSATSIHNEMLKSRPDLLEALYDGFVWMRRYRGRAVQRTDTRLCNRERQGRFTVPPPLYRHRRRPGRHRVVAPAA
ncbi:MAG: TauD/TfdA family dioxygenase [Betaproteobacteria bacterium]|nr:TauD/TfdA family dioxygenase [Betaproteobacteria bacterium]